MMLIEAYLPAYLYMGLKRDTLGEFATSPMTLGATHYTCKIITLNGYIHAEIYQLSPWPNIHNGILSTLFMENGALVIR